MLTALITGCTMSGGASPKYPEIPFGETWFSCGNMNVTRMDEVDQQFEGYRVFSETGSGVVKVDDAIISRGGENINLYILMRDGCLTGISGNYFSMMKYEDRVRRVDTISGNPFQSSPNVGSYLQSRDSDSGMQDLIFVTARYGFGGQFDALPQEIIIADGRPRAGDANGGKIVLGNAGAWSGLHDAVHILEKDF